MRDIASDAYKAPFSSEEKRAIILMQNGKNPLMCPNAVGSAAHMKSLTGGALMLSFGKLFCPVCEETTKRAISAERLNPYLEQARSGTNQPTETLTMANECKKYIIKVAHKTDGRVGYINVSNTFTACREDAKQFDTLEATKAYRVSSTWHEWNTEAEPLEQETAEEKGCEEGEGFVVRNTTHKRASTKHLHFCDRDAAYAEAIRFVEDNIGATSTIYGPLDTYSTKPTVTHTIHVDKKTGEDGARTEG